ncbi:MAG: hypothetical protein SCK28_03205 [Bacillota bacterium]|nr:hypothetical protein [Bacillota bacterium]
MEWIKVNKLYDTEEKAQKAANIIATTEARLASQPKGPQYEVETKIEPVEEKWQVLWRKVFVGYQSGCGGGGCCSCQDTPKKKEMGKVIPFKKPSSTL